MQSVVKYLREREPIGRIAVQRQAKENDPPFAESVEGANFFIFMGALYQRQVDIG
jgi:hypothetical protein